MFDKIWVKIPMKELSWLLDNLEVEGVAKLRVKNRKGCSKWHLLNQEQILILQILNIC